MAVKMPGCPRWLIALIFFLSFISAAPAFATEIPSKVTVAISEDYPPYNAVDGQGRPWGWLVDIWRLWSKKTGIEVKFVAAPFVKTLKLVGSGKVDIHGGCFYSKQRAEYLEYVAPLLKSTTSYFFHKGIFGIRNVVDLAPYRVGVIKGDYLVGYLQDKLPEASLAEFDTYKDMFTALKAGDIRVFASDTPVGLYFLKKWDLLSEFTFLPDKPLYSAEFQAAVKKGNTRLAKVVGRGLELITPAERVAIERRWSGETRGRKKGALLVACQRQNAPLSSLSATGRPTGILVDIWRLWAAKAGQRIEFVFGTQSEIFDWARKGRVDVVSGLVREPYMNRWMAFSIPLFIVNTGLFYRVQDGPVGPKDLAGQNVGVLKGSFVMGLLARSHPGISFEQVTNRQRLARKLIQGEFRAVASVAVCFEEILNNMGLSGEIAWSGRPLSVQSLQAGVAKGRPELLTQVNKGLAAISRREILAMEKRWVPDETMQHFAKTGVKFELSPAEKKWLARHREIRLGVDPAYMPFEGMDQNENFLGIASDYVKLISAKLGSRIVPVPGTSWKDTLEKARLRQVDLLACVTPTPGRGKYLSFTRPYISSPYMVLTREDAPFISGLKFFRGKRLAVIDGDAIQGLLAKDHPRLELVPVSNLEEGLAAVKGGGADGFVDSQTSLNYMLNKTGTAGLKIALTTEYRSELAFGVRRDWPQLAGILEKALLSIPETEREKFVERWTNVRFQRSTDWGFILRVGGAVALAIAIILAIIIIWNRRMAREVAQRKQAEERLAAIVASVPGAIFQSHIYGRRREYSYLSQRAEEFFGAPPEEVIRDKKILPWHPEDMERVSQEMDEAISAGGSYINLVARIVPPGGELKWVRLTASFAKTSKTDLLATGFILDVTARKQAELEYLAAERKVKAMSQAVEDALIMIDGKGEVLFWNHAAERLFGFSEAEALGMDFHAMAAPEEHQDKIKPGMERFAREGRGVVLGTTTETTARNRVGDNFPVEVTLSSFQLEDQWYAVGTVRDITERKRAEEALRESEELSRRILDSAGEGIFGVDAQGCITFVNPAAVQMLGFKEDELRGQKVHALIHHHRADGSEYPLDECPMWASYSRGEPHHIDDEVLWHKDGGSFPAEYASTPIAKEGKVIGAVVTFRDISERKEAESEIRQKTEQFTKLITTLPDAVTQTDIRGKITYVSPQVCKVYGLEDESQAIGTNSLQWMHQDFHEIARAKIAKLVSDPEKLETPVSEFLLLKKDGTTFWGALKTSVLLDENGTPIGLITVTRDITERKQAEEELRRNLDELERFNRLTIGREERMIALKEEINQLLEKTGRGKKYRIVDQADIQ